MVVMMRIGVRNTIIQLGDVKLSPISVTLIRKIKMQKCRLKSLISSKMAFKMQKCI